MPIVCFEGPSAVGKTTAALALGRDAYVVPEVNALFERPANETPEWYLERQVDRWLLAKQHASDCPLVVLDGDPFQPLWYNWAYDFNGLQSLDLLEAFYRPRIVQGQLSFPDRYFVFGASVPTLRLRKENDPTRQRRGFESHLGFIGPQRRYFQAMQSFAPERVAFLEPREVGEGVPSVSASARTAAIEVALFDSLVQWLRSHAAVCGLQSAAP